MKELKTFTEVKTHFASVRVGDKMRLVFKTANRTIEDIDGTLTIKTKDGKEFQGDKKRIPYPVLIPAKDVTDGDYLAQLSVLGFDSKQILRKGIVLYFSGKYVPNGLCPTKAKRAKRYSIAFESEFIATLDAEAFMEMRSNMPSFIQKAWESEDSDGIAPEFCFVSDKLAKELDDFADALLK